MPVFERAKSVLVGRIGPPTNRRGENKETLGCSCCARTDTTSMGQFGVDPPFQGRGIGASLMEMAERRARERGAAWIAIDTSEHATELIATYRRRGYEIVESVQWDVTNYRSVVLAKRL